MIATLGTVLEAAEIRAAQWRGISNGAAPTDVVNELYESLADDAYESASIAEEQEAAIRLVRQSLPAKGVNYLPDTLALTAMCLWEATLELQRNFKAHSITQEPVLKWLAEGEGACSARQGCWDLSGWAELAFAKLGDPRPSEYAAFDWDFIPRFLEEIHSVCSSHGIAVLQIDENYVDMAVAAMLK